MLPEQEKAFIGAENINKDRPIKNTIYNNTIHGTIKIETLFLMLEVPQ